MLYTELKVETRGSPKIKDLSEHEREIFFESIFERIIEISSVK